MGENFFLIGGPCVIECKETALQIAEHLNNICKKLNITYIFKGSYNKANRTRIDSFRGLEAEQSLEILRFVGNKLKVPVLTDVHESTECELVAQYVDYLQIPAFLCRQTDLLLAAGRTGKGINIKKGQFLSPEAMGFAKEKVVSTGNDKIWLTERGTTFGYESLVVDMTAVPRMQKFAKVVMDCTHSVQRPNQTSGITGGDPQLIETIALAATAAGADGLFIEAHPNPASALSDSGSMLQLDRVESILTKCVAIRSALSSCGKLG